MVTTPSGRTGSNSFTSPAATVTFAFSTAINITDFKIFNLNTVKQHALAFRFNNVSASTVTDCTFVGGGIDFTDSASNTFTNTRWAHHVWRNVHANYNLSDNAGLGYLPDGTRLQNGTTYWIRMRTYLSNVWHNQPIFFDTGVYGVTPRALNNIGAPPQVTAIPLPQATPAIEIKIERRANWSRNNNLQPVLEGDFTGALSANTSYEIYRGTTPGFATRDATTRLGRWIFTTAGTSTVITDSATRTITATAASSTFAAVGGSLPAVAYGTTYYYVIRKYNDDLGTDFIEVEVPCVCVDHRRLVTNLLAANTGNDFTSATWVKTGTFTVATSTSLFALSAHRTGFTTGANLNSETLADSIPFPATADPALAQTVTTGIVAGQTYTFGVYLNCQTASQLAMRLQLVDNATTPVTATANVTINMGYQLYTVSITTGAGATQLICRLIKPGSATATVIAGNAFLNLGANPVAFVDTFNTPTNMARPFTTGATIGPWSWTKTPGNWITCVPGAATTGTYTEFHISTDSGFTPSVSTRFAWVWDQFMTCGSRFLNFTRSNGNTVTGVTHIGVGCDGIGNGNRDAWVGLVQSSNNRFINWTMYPNGNRGILVDATNLSNNNFFHNIRLFGNPRYLTQNQLLTTNSINNSNGLIVQNLLADNGDVGIAGLVSGVQWKSVTAADQWPASNVSVISAVTAPVDALVHGSSTAYQAVYDTIFGQFNNSDAVTGRYAVVFTPSQLASKPYTINTPANPPVFSNTGVLFFTAPAQQITYTVPYRVYGISGFSTVFEPLVYSLDIGNTTKGILIQKEISVSTTDDTGWSSWVDITWTGAASGLSGLTAINTAMQTAGSAAAGILLRFRFSSRAGIRFTANLAPSNLPIPGTVDGIRASGLTGRATYWGYELDATHNANTITATCVAVQTTNLASLSGVTTVDTVALATGNLVLLTGQTTASQNGVYSWAANTLTRIATGPLSAGNPIRRGTVIEVTRGSNSNIGCWQITSVGGGVWGTNSVTIAVMGTLSGMLWVTGVTGNWATTNTIIQRTSDTRTISTTSVANATPIFPQATSFIGKFEVGTLVDPSVLYAVSRPTLRVYGLKSNSEVRVYSVSTGQEIAGTDSTTTEWSVQYDFFGIPIPVYIHIHHLSWAFQRIETTLGSAGLELPVQQSLDRTYVNP